MTDLQSQILYDMQAIQRLTEQNEKLMRELRIEKLRNYSLKHQLQQFKTRPAVRRAMASNF